MIIVYSEKPIDSLGGRYIAPRLFDGIISGAKVVYTSDSKITEAYTAKGVEVRGFPKSKAKPKESGTIIKNGEVQ